MNFLGDTSVKMAMASGSSTKLAWEKMTLAIALRGETLITKISL